MTKAALRKAVLALPKRDRRALRRDLDLSLIENETVVEIPESHKRYLEEVIAYYDKNPTPLISHEQLMAHLKERKMRRLAGKRAGKRA